jgi:hypothetical protein
MQLRVLFHGAPGLAACALGGPAEDASTGTEDSWTGRETSTPNRTLARLALHVTDEGAPASSEPRSVLVHRHRLGALKRQDPWDVYAPTQRRAKRVATARATSQLTRRRESRRPAARLRKFSRSAGPRQPACAARDGPASSAPAPRGATTTALASTTNTEPHASPLTTPHTVTPWRSRDPAVILIE